MTLQANWKDHIVSLPTNEEGSIHSNRYTDVSLSINEPRATRLLKLTQSVDNVILYANNKNGIDLAHSGTNMGGTLSRNEDKIVFLVGSERIAIEFQPDSLLERNTSALRGLN